MTLEARKPASEKPKDEATLAAESAEAERKLQLQARLHTAEARLDALDSEQRAKLEESFRQQLAADNKLIYDSLRKQEFSGPLYRKLLIQHV
ncbi:replication protein, partial [Xanthomonas perforans]